MTDAAAPGREGPELDFPVSLLNPGQIESALSWQALQAAVEKPAWWADYLAIREAFPHFRNWRIWVYIAWAGQPAAARQPRTAQELAAQVLGCTDRAIRNWHAKDYGDDASIEEAIAWVKASPLLRHRRDIYDALVIVAKMPDPKAHNDRRMALEMMGDYRPRGVNDPDEKEQGKIDGYLRALKEAA